LGEFVAKVQAKLERVKMVKHESQKYLKLLDNEKYLMNGRVLVGQIGHLDDQIKRMEDMLDLCEDPFGEGHAKMEEFREALYQHKIDEMLVEWDYVYERYSRSAEQVKPTRVPEEKKTMKEHADFVFYETWAMGCGVAHWGIGESDRETGPEYPRCRCFDQKEKK
jgi:hypothetical protein